MLRSLDMGFRLQRRSLLAGSLLAVACYSPTLPLPPPGEPEVIGLEGTVDRYRLIGRVEPQADVHAINVRTQLLAGQRTGSDGRYDFEVQGLQGDQMELWYVVGNDPSPRVFFLLPPIGDSGGAGAGGVPAQ